MPRHGKNIQKTATGRWEVQFKVKETITENGETRTVWRGKRRAFDSLADAEDFRNEVRLAASRGERWEDERTVATITLGSLAEAYNAAAVNSPESTQRFRKSMMNAWITWAGEATPVTQLSAAFVERYAAHLPADGRAASTRHRKILEVERMWRWARRRPDLFPGVPEVVQITGDDAGAVRAPPPVVRLAAPTWDDVDAMIVSINRGYKHGELHKRVALLLRYTGLRISQAITLRWDDVRLGEKVPYLVVRAGRRGAKSSRGRVLPLHPQLVELLRSWQPEPGGLVFEGEGARWSSGEATREALRTAWGAAGVAKDRWDVSEAEKEAGERAHGSPCHAIRAAVKVGLLRAGVVEAVADYLIGHSRGSTQAAYVPESAPETSPWWPMLVEAVGKIPIHGE